VRLFRLRRLFEGSGMTVDRSQDIDTGERGIFIQIEGGEGWRSLELTDAQARRLASGFEILRRPGRRRGRRARLAAEVRRAEGRRRG